MGIKTATTGYEHIESVLIEVKSICKNVFLDKIPLTKFLRREFTSLHEDISEFLCDGILTSCSDILIQAIEFIDKGIKLVKRILDVRQCPERMKNNYLFLIDFYEIDLKTRLSHI